MDEQGTHCLPPVSSPHSTDTIQTDQAHLLSTLSTQDTSSTHLYTTFLLVLPLAPVLFYLPLLFRLGTIIPSTVAIASFLASAYALYYLPLPPVRINIINLDGESISGGGKGKGKGKGIARGADGLPSTSGSAQRRPVPYLSEEAAEALARYIVPGNAALCGVLAIFELWKGREWSEGLSIGGGYLPGLVLAVVLWARRELRVVDLGELERLRVRNQGT